MIIEGDNHALDENQKIVDKKKLVARDGTSDNQIVVDDDSS